MMAITTSSSTSVNAGRRLAASPREREAVEGLDGFAQYGPEASLDPDVGDAVVGPFGFDCVDQIEQGFFALA